VKLKFNKLTSTKTLLPLDPYASNIGLCIPDEGVYMDKENLGELLQGDRIQDSPYTIIMKLDMFCQPLCVKDLGQDLNNPMELAIRNAYHQNWLLDGLPAASLLENDEYIVTRYWQGVPLGWLSPEDENNVVVFNHVNIIIHYRQIGDNSFEITRFLVEPFSIKHEYTSAVDKSGFNVTTPIPSCLRHNKHTDYESIQPLSQQNQTGKVLFTYDVTWMENQDLTWSKRWNIYLNMDDAIPEKVHWLSIANTSFVLLICSCVIVRVWRRNISGYTRVINNETPVPPEEPWHLIKNDVFRAPDVPVILAVGSGTGAQLLVTAFLVTISAMTGITNQSHPGALSQSLIVVYMFTGFFNGYVTVLYYRIFQGKLPWRRVCLISATAFPLLGILVFLGLQIIVHAANSTYAVPLSTVLILFVTWGGLASPLAILGGWLAKRNAPIRFPLNVNESTRNVPPSTCRDWVWAILFLIFSGLYTFGTMYVEFYYILASAWMGYYYNSFFDLTMVLLVMVIACATTSILYTYYFVFRKQIHCWWWRSFFFGCITGLCSFLYSFVYFRTFQSNNRSAALLFFCEMFLMSLGLSLALGFVALSSAMWFSRRLYGVFDDDSPDDHVEMNETEILPPPNGDNEEQSSSAIGEMT